jgi:hypothetical protein
MNFVYQQLYSNGINSNSQIRRSADMIYQRGGTYEVVLLGDTYEQSVVLDVNLYVNDLLKGNMNVVPYKINLSGSTWYYYFNIRPYQYLSNYVQTEHYQYYWLNNWYNTTSLINWNNPYPNNIKINVDYKYKYFLNGQYTGETSYNSYNHYYDVPDCINDLTFTVSGATNTGKYFDYVGGTFQLEDNFIYQNFDQEIGTIIEGGFTISDVSLYRRLSPMTQFLMDYPTVPEQSETSRFLTESPRIQYIQSNENYVLYYLNGQTGDGQVIEADYVVFEFYNSSNTKIQTINKELNFSGTTYASPTGRTDNLRVFSLPCGPIDINNLMGTVDFNTVAYYTTQLYYSYPTNNSLREVVGPIGPTSETFYFYLYNNCKPENTRLCWLNSRGGYDYFTFVSYRQDSGIIKRETYDSRYYSPSLPSPDRNIGRSVKTFDTNVDQQIVLDTGYLNVQYSNWIEGLFYSPQVYLIQNDYISPIDRQDKVYKDLTPVNILSTQVDKFTKKHQKLNKYEITLSTSNTYMVNKGF